MDLQTFVMIEQAGNDREYLPHKDDKGYFGGLYVNHPSPSGNPRPMLVMSDNRRFKTKEEAVEQFKLMAEQVISGVRPAAMKKLAEIRAAFTPEKESDKCQESQPASP